MGIKTGITDLRRTDSKGRITIPIEIRKVMETNKFFVYYDREHIILEAVR
jgi:bifunctional DNA-binding transcriptional regulator/antitoxin component of YhaV-PrlF toxin-antitoxin module